MSLINRKWQLVQQIKAIQKAEGLGAQSTLAFQPASLPASFPMFAHLYLNTYVGHGHRQRFHVSLGWDSMGSGQPKALQDNQFPAKYSAKDDRSHDGLRESTHSMNLCPGSTFCLSTWGGKGRPRLQYISKWYRMNLSCEPWRPWRRREHSLLKTSSERKTWLKLHPGSQQTGVSGYLNVPTE